MKHFICTVLLLLVASSLTGVANAAIQGPPPPPEMPPMLVRVFLDCQYRCDTEFIQQNITFVEYVRDRAVSDLHVLVTTQDTGGGGTSWVLDFMGQGYFQGQNRKLTLATSGDATEDEQRKDFARVLRIGLVGYAAVTSVAGDLDVTSSRTTAANQTSPTKDAWNYWVFNIGVNGYLNGEQSSSNQSHYFNFSASRTTEEWKINVSSFTSSNSSKFLISDTETIKSNSESWNVNSLIVNSLGPQWSVGGRTGVSHSSYSNTDLSINVAPSIEYDFFPYSMSSRKSLTVQYAIGVTRYKYRELTIFDKLQESIPNHSVNASVGIRAPWGTLSGSSTLSENLNHRDQYRISLYGATSVRLFKGFSFNVSGGYNRIRDQIGLSKDEATTEEVLLRLQQRPTGYSYNMNFGVSYSFGSIFNSVVNPRFNGSVFF